MWTWLDYLTRHCLRRAMALPFYAVAWLLDFQAAGIKVFAAWIAGDDRPASRPDRAAPIRGDYHDGERD